MDFCVNCGNKQLDLICTKCNEKNIRTYENKLIEEFLEDLRRLPDSKASFRLLEKWEARKDES